MRAGLIESAKHASTPIRGRKSLYALKNWIAAAEKEEDKDLIAPLEITLDDEDEV